MSKFVLIYTGGGIPESKEEQDAVMGAWGAWYGEMGAAIVDGGAPFSGSKHVGKNGVGDGPVSSPPATGYSVINADSLDDAVAKVKNHPHIKYGGQVSVYETIKM